MRKASLTVVLVLISISGAGVAQADLVPYLNSEISSGQLFQYNYTANLANEERLDPAATGGVTCPGGVQCNPTGTFFTLYNIPGFNSAATPSGWSYTAQLTGLTPSSISGGTVDNPALTNVTFQYTGPVVHANGVTVSIAGFEILSSVDGVNVNGSYSSQSTLDVGGSVGLTDQAVGGVSVPSVSVGTAPSTAGGGALIPILNAGPTPVSTGFAYNYDALLGGQERLDPAATNGVTCPGDGVKTLCNAPGSFFTIYDIPGFVSANTTGIGWSVSTQLVGLTPSSINDGTVDDPSLTDVTFSYTGPVIHANGSTVDFSGFQIISTIPLTNANGAYSTQSTQDDSLGYTNQDVGSVVVPLEPAATPVPEPASLSLLFSGLLGLATFHGLRLTASAASGRPR